MRETRLKQNRYIQVTLLIVRDRNSTKISLMKQNKTRKEGWKGKERRKERKGKEKGKGIYYFTSLRNLWYHWLLTLLDPEFQTVNQLFVSVPVSLSLLLLSSPVSVLPSLSFDVCISRLFITLYQV